MSLSLTVPKTETLEPPVSELNGRLAPALVIGADPTVTVYIPFRFANVNVVAVGFPFTNPLTLTSSAWPKAMQVSANAKTIPIFLIPRLCMGLGGNRRMTVPWSGCPGIADNHPDSGTNIPSRPASPTCLECDGVAGSRRMTHADVRLPRSRRKSPGFADLFRMRRRSR